MDPALRELLRAGTDDEVAVILRLKDPDNLPPGVRIVSRFGEVVTARVRRTAIRDLWADPSTISVKAPHEYGPEELPLVSEPVTVNDTRRPPGLTATGKGVLVGVVDWGCDIAHPDFRSADGTTRLRAVWDQRPTAGTGVAPYGYGRVLSRPQIDEALHQRNPYAALDYHPGDFDGGLGAHGTHTLGVAAGNGRAGGSPGMAPEADCAFVNLGRGRGSDAVPLGSSTELLEALDWLDHLAGPQPLVVNLSLGRHAGAHCGRTLLERAMDHLVTSRPGRAIVQSCGNYFERRTHGSWQLHPGDRQDVTIEVDPTDRTANTIDIWYPGADRLSIDITCPALGLSASVARGGSATLTHGERHMARAYHRAHDPNNGDHQCSVVIEPDSQATLWVISLVAEDVVDGRVHLWIERDTGCRTCQSRLPGADADPRTTIGTIANGYRTLVVGAVDSHRPGTPVARFSSSGPTRDGRVKPDLCAPGVMVMGPRSHPRHGVARSAYVRMSGTSMASPVVAGAIALLFEVAGPLPVEATRRAVLAACTPVEGADPARTGAGLLDVAAMLAHLGRSQFSTARSARPVHTDPGSRRREEMARTDGTGQRLGANQDDDVTAAERGPGCGCADGVPEPAMLERDTDLLSEAAENEQEPATVNRTGAPRSPSQVRVAVIGAGLSGLMTARSLVGGRFAVTVFEASDRLGGRVETRRDLLPGKVVESGAELIGKNHPRWRLLARTLGLDLIPVTTDEDYARSKLTVRWRLHGSDLTSQQKKEITRKVRQVQKVISEEARKVPVLQPWAVADAARLDRLSVAERLRGTDLFGPGPALARDYLEMMLSNDQCAPTARQSYLGLLAAVSAHRMGDDLDSYWKDTETYRCAGGNDQLATKLATGLPDVRRNSPVRRLQVDRDRVRVEFTHRGDPTWEEFDFVILAAPPNGWPAVESEPAFRPADYRISHGPAVKFLSTGATEFWKKRKLAPIMLSDEAGSIWEGTDTQPPGNGGYALNVYSGGPLVHGTDRYAARLEEYYPGYKAWVAQQVLADWPNRPGIRTGYSVPAPGEVTTVAKNLSQPFRGRIFFAGEQASPGFFGYMEGALETGLRAAGQVAVTASRMLTPPDGPPADLADPPGHPSTSESPDRDGVPASTDTSEATPPPCVPAAEPGPAGGPPHPVIRSGSRRPVVGYAQTKLNAFLAQYQAGTLVCPSSGAATAVNRAVAALRAAGQLPLTVDCDFGAHTERAVRAVQTCYSLNRDGIIGRETWPVLNTLGAAAPAPFRLLADVARTGTPAPATPGWQWGAGGAGAVMLANVDDDGGTGWPDNEDSVVDPGNDAAELSPLILERTGAPTPGTVVELRVSDPARLRVFAGRAAGAREILGPGTGATHRFPGPLPPRTELSLEAVSHPRRGFTGEVSLTLRITTPGAPPMERRMIVRVAPWLAFHHLHRAETVFVVDAGSANARFRVELRGLVTAAGCRLVEIPAPSGDIWAQDCMEFGYATVPGTTLRSVLRAPRDRGLLTFPRTLFGPDLGYLAEGDLSVTTGFDATGNLEASPPVTVGGKRYPGGRIYYGTATGPGDVIDPLLRDFLHAQVVQDPIVLDTSWLAVGHVDEVVSFVPAPGGFRMLMASPRRAYEILDALAGPHGGAPILTGRRLRREHPTPGRVPVEHTVRDFLTLRDDFNPELRHLMGAGHVAHTPRTLRAYNLDRQTDIDRMRARLTAGLGITDADVIDVPAVFMPNPTAPSVTDALVPGMVNMLVVNGHCIVPKPFGPVAGGVDRFEQDVRDRLGPLGLTVRFLDCWEEYHVLLGEVHCATNSLRAAAPLRWWEFQP